MRISPVNYSFNVFCVYSLLIPSVKLSNGWETMVNGSINNEVAITISSADLSSLPITTTDTGDQVCMLLLKFHVFVEQYILSYVDNFS